MLLTLKLLMTPFLIASVTLVGRRWGPGIGGWLMGFPLTSGPVSILLVLQYGKDFAARAAVGTLGGQASVCVFCLAYCLVAPVAGWPVSLGVAIGAFFLSVLCWNAVALALLPTYALTLVFVALVLWWIPAQAVSTRPSEPPRWDLPARMAAAAAFVVALTALAQSLGPQLSGLLSPFPIFSIVIAAFTHQQQGATAARQLLRGVVLGSIGFGCFFLVVGALLPSLSPLWTYLAATLAAVSVNGLVLRLSGLKEARRILT
jgi:hypothetical protein